MKNYATFKDLKDASVFITGGGSGIGASITEGFLSQGAKVAFVQRSNCDEFLSKISTKYKHCLLYTSPSPRDKRQSRMPSSA